MVILLTTFVFSQNTKCSIDARCQLCSKETLKLSKIILLKQWFSVQKYIGNYRFSDLQVTFPEAFYMKSFVFFFLLLYLKWTAYSATLSQSRIWSYLRLPKSNVLSFLIITISSAPLLITLITHCYDKRSTKPFNQSCCL